MNNALEQVKEWRVKADALRAERKWADAAKAYRELAAAWIRAAAIASSPGGRANRMALADMATACADDCQQRAQEPARQGNQAAQPPVQGNAQGARPAKGNGVGEKDLGPCEPLEDLLKQLDALVGLDGVKEQVRMMVSYLRVRQWREANGLPNVPMTNHLVFTGNPGTGKTTVARLIAKIYRALGILERGQLVETTPAGLVAGFLGQTALKTQAKIEEALGGVLFIDEAYGLIPDHANDFASQAIDTLVPEMTNHCHDLVVIVAGYPDLMHKFIYETNPGLPARFPTTIHFDDYSSDELVEIFKRSAQDDQHQYKLAEGCLAAVRKHYEDVKKAKPADFGNARLVRNLLEGAIKRQSQRLAAAHGGQPPSREDLQTLTVEDLEASIAKQRQELSQTK